MQPIDQNLFNCQDELEMERRGGRRDRDKRRSRSRSRSARKNIDKIVEKMQNIFQKVFKKILKCPILFKGPSWILKINLLSGEGEAGAGTEADATKKGGWLRSFLEDERVGVSWVLWEVLVEGRTLGHNSMCFVSDSSKVWLEEEYWSLRLNLSNQTKCKDERVCVCSCTSF